MLIVVCSFKCVGSVDVCWFKGIASIVVCSLECVCSIVCSLKAYVLVVFDRCRLKFWRNV